MRNGDESDMDGMRQGIPRGFNGATTTCNGENGPGCYQRRELVSDPPV